jgi:shikimate kinase
MSDTSRPARVNEHVPENIFLVGLMGAGKTSVGKLLAQRLGKDFYDSDHEIEAATGVKIALIFEIEGESGFRARESKMLVELANRENVLIATGGGAVLSASNRKILADRGIVVYLRAAPVDLWRRTRHDKHRPLLKTEDRMARFEQLFAERDPLYLEIADIIVDTGSQSVGALASRLERKILEFKAQAGGSEDNPLRAG